MHIQFAELPVFDQERAKKFYVDHFDCQVVADAPMGKDGWRWIELKFAGAETTLHFLRRKDDAPSDEPVLVLVDDDVEATTAGLKSKGVEIITEPQEAPWAAGRTVAEFRDSEGNRLVIGSNDSGRPSAFHMKPESAGDIAMTQPTKSSTLKLPGARIYYEVQGSGPTLLMIPGGPTDAGVFADLSGRLADRYTVVTYDPRGNSRSTFDGEPEEQQLDVHGDDAARLIEAFGDGPGYVFGTSGGAQIGLNLTARYPERVRAVVAHEPPCLMMLPDPSKAVAEDREVYDTYRREGVGAAMRKFMVMSGMADAPPPVPPTPEAIEMFARIEGNMEYFLAHGLMPLSLYRPDVDALRRSESHVVVGIGEQSVGQITHRTSVALAEKLGTEPVLFPGDHGGYGPHADTFAETLHRALSGE